MKIFCITSIYFVSILTLISCKQELPTSEDEKSTKPIVNIISPLQNASVVDSTVIEVEATDDKGITRVEIYIDNILDTSRVIIIKPYRWIWDVQDLQDSSVHIIYAKAFDADGNVSSSSVITVTIFKLTPSNLHVLTINEDEIVLQWQDNSRIETAFVIEKGNDDINFFPIDTVGANINNIAIQGTYLATNKYYFRVKALSNSKISKYSNIAMASFSFQAPTNLAIISTAEDAIQLQWHDNSTIEKGFEIEEQINGNNFAPVDTVDANDTTAIIIGAYLTTNTYNFRVRAIGKANASDYSNIATTTLLFPGPTNLTVLSIAENAVLLQWQDNSSFETSFEIQQSTDGNNFVAVEIASSNETTATVTGLYITTDFYYFRVRAKSTLNGSLYSNKVRVYYSDELYAGGSFTSTGSKAVKGIAKWNGVEWSSVSIGINGGVGAFGVYNNELYVGGNFNYAGGVNSPNIAKWNMKNWSGVGSGTNSSVMAFAVFENEIHVGGEFSIPGQKIAKWNGSSWSAIGGGLSDHPKALFEFNNELYAAGNIVLAGAVGVKYIARWNGSTWSEVGGGVSNGLPYAMAVFNNELFVGGDFDTAAGIPANHIAKWNGVEWSNVGSGVKNGYVSSFSLFNNELYVGGDFDSAGTKSTNRIAKWNGIEWSELGAGISGGGVYSITVYHDELYVGGYFNNAGGIHANYIAKWNGTNWSTVGDGFNNYVHSLAVYSIWTWEALP